MSTNRFNLGSLLNVQDTLDDCIGVSYTNHKTLTRMMLGETRMHLIKVLEELKLADKLMDGEISQEQYQKEFDLII